MIRGTLEEMKIVNIVLRNWMHSTLKEKRDYLAVLDICLECLGHTPVEICEYKDAIINTFES